MILYFNFDVQSAIEYAGDIFKNWIKETGIDFYEVKNQDPEYYQIETILKVKPKLIILNEIFQKSYVSSLFYKKMFPNTKIICIGHIWEQLDNNLKNDSNLCLHLFLRECNSIICLNYNTLGWSHNTPIKIQNYYYPTDPSIFNIKTEWKDRKNDFVYIGNILPHKLSYEFLEKFKYTDLKLQCYGKRFKDEVHKEYYKLFDSCNNIIYHEVIPQYEVSIKFNEYKYFLLPHDGYEPFNWTILQSAYCGTIPLVINDTKTNKFDPRWLNWSKGMIFSCDKVDHMIQNLKEIVKLQPDYSQASKDINKIANEKFNYDKFKNFFINLVNGVYNE